jgi:hypothetical protein
MGLSLLNMAEASKAAGKNLQAGVQMLIVQENPMFEKISWAELGQGKGSYGWHEDGALPSVAFRAVNASYTADVGHIVPRSEGLSILGGEVKLDRFLQSTTGAGGGDRVSLDQKAIQFEMKARAAKLEFEEQFFEGDSGLNFNAFDGLRARAIENSSQNIVQAAGGGTLTLAKMDEVADSIRGGPSGWAMNVTLRRKVNALIRAASTAQEMVTTEFGKQLPTYAGVPMWVVQREDDQSTILGFDEDPGDGAADTASIYGLRFGNEDDIFGILGSGGAWEVQDFGELQASPQLLGRMEVYIGLVVKHKRSFARLYGVTNT